MARPLSRSRLTVRTALALCAALACSAGLSAKAVANLLLENGTRVATQALTVNSRVAGNLSNANGEWYYTDLAQPGELVFQTLGNRNTYCALYDVSGTMLAVNYDGPDGVNCSVRHAVAAGRYYLVVLGNDASQYGPYSAELTLINAVSTPAPVSATGGVQVFDSAWLQALQNRAQTQSQQRPPLTLPNGQTVSDCRSYQRLAAGVDVDALPASAQATSLSDGYAICELAALLGDRPLQAALASAGQQAGLQLKQRLDLRSFRSSFGPRVRNGDTPAKLTDLAFQVTPTALTLDTADQYFQIRLLAIGNLNADPRPDWVLEVQDHLHDGFYSATSLLIITDVDAGQTPLAAAPLSVASSATLSQR